MLDPRITRLARNLVNYSVAAKKGDKVLIEATDVDTEMVTELVKAVYEVGAYPFVETYKGKVNAAVISGTSEEHSRLMAEYAKYRMERMDCYIGVRGAYNT